MGLSQRQLSALPGFMIFDNFNIFQRLLFFVFIQNTENTYVLYFNYVSLFYTLSNIYSKQREPSIKLSSKLAKSVIGFGIIYVTNQTGLVFNKTILSRNDLSNLKQNNIT